MCIRDRADVGRASRQRVADDYVRGCYGAAVDVAQDERELIAPVGRRMRAADLLFQHDVGRSDRVAVVRGVVRGVRIRAVQVVIADRGAVCDDGALRRRGVHIDIEVQREILESIESFLKANPNSFEFVPTNMSLTNLTLSALLGRFNDLLIIPFADYKKIPIY